MAASCCKAYRPKDSGPTTQSSGALQGRQRGSHQTHNTVGRGENEQFSNKIDVPRYYQPLSNKPDTHDTKNRAGQDVYKNGIDKTDTPKHNSKDEDASEESYTPVIKSSTLPRKCPPQMFWEKLIDNKKGKCKINISKSCLASSLCLEPEKIKLYLAIEWVIATPTKKLRY